mgnify:CR=1 FL=1|jgi:hypothetical protein
MKIVTWSMDTGTTFAVVFDNGQTAAEYIAVNPKTERPFYEEWSPKKALAAGEKFRKAKGDNWEHGDLRWEFRDPKDGYAIKRIFRSVAVTV